MTGHELAFPEERQRSALRSAVVHTGLTLEDLWMRYFALGGNADLMDVDAHLSGLTDLSVLQRDILAHAVNERLDELITQHRVPYSRVLRQSEPTTGPLAALVALLSAAGSAPPERLPTLVAAAGQIIGVGVVVHLVDPEQRQLVRMPTAQSPGGTRRGLDGTLAGRAFRTVRTYASEREGTLWVPVLDGADRLGLLDVTPASRADLYDPSLRQHCQWLGSLLGHLIVSMGSYGDELERARLSQARSPSAELIWQQLPPLTAGTDAFVLAGMLEPSYEIGGDAFDYALSERLVSLAIFDAVGHGLPASLMAAAALAGYRSARRDARNVYDQARAIDDLISGSFPDSAFVTGVLAELDVRSGRLRYVNAGQPRPLLLRSGRVVKELTGDRRIPFGLGTSGLTVGEEILQPGDWLALYTDGVTEARDPAGAWFGEERLVKFLTHEIAAGQPPPETVRRLTRAVLEHQRGVLQDDASILLARWAGDRPT